MKLRYLFLLGIIASRLHAAEQTDKPEKVTFTIENNLPGNASNYFSCGNQKSFRYICSKEHMSLPVVDELLWNINHTTYYTLTKAIIIAMQGKTVAIVQEGQKIIVPDLEKNQEDIRKKTVF